MKKYFVISFVSIAGILASQPKSILSMQLLSDPQAHEQSIPQGKIHVIQNTIEVNAAGNLRSRSPVMSQSPAFDGYNAGMMPQACSFPGMNSGDETHAQDKNDDWV